MGVVQGCILRGKNQQRRKQLGRYQNRENKSNQVNGSKQCNKNVIKERSVIGTKHCYKPNSVAILLTKIRKSQLFQTLCDYDARRGVELLVSAQ